MDTGKEVTIYRLKSNLKKKGSLMVIGGENPGGFPLESEFAHARCSATPALTGAPGAKPRSPSQAVPRERGFRFMSESWRFVISNSS